MQTPIDPNINWEKLFSEYLQSELVKPARHKWATISNEIVKSNEHCIYTQCEHCKKYMSMFTHDKNAYVFLNNTQVAHVTATIKPFAKVSLCERLLIMS